MAENNKLVESQIPEIYLSLISIIRCFDENDYFAKIKYLFTRQLIL